MNNNYYNTIILYNIDNNYYSGLVFTKKKEF